MDDGPTPTAKGSSLSQPAGTAPASQSARPQGSDLLSVSFVTVAAAAAALAFNAGFFMNIGFPFAGLYGLQEHFVFSIVGLSVVALVFNLFVLVSILLEFRWRPGAPSHWRIIGQIIFVFAIGQQIWAIWDDYGGLAAFIALAIAVVAVFVGGIVMDRRVFEIYGREIDRRYALAALFMFVCALSGMYYAQTAMQGGARPVVAIDRSGTARQLVRVGDSYALVIDDRGMIRGVPVAELVGFRRLGEGL